MKKFSTVCICILLSAVFLIIAARVSHSQNIGAGRSRGVWVGRKFLASLTKQDVVQLLEAYGRAHLNMVFVESIAAGESVYESQFLKQNKLFAAKEKDFYKFFIDEAHKRGMEVHAWVWTFCVGSGFEENDFVKEHKNWLAQDRKENATTDGGSYFLNPAHPEVQAFLKKVFEELVQKFDVDGVQFDYVRYPHPFPYAYSFDDTSEKLFSQKESVSLKSLTPQQSFSLYERWKKWKEEYISSFLRETGKALRQKKPGLFLSAAVYPEYPNFVSQDWKAWLDEKIIDFLCPMVYFSSTLEFERNLTSLQHIASEHLVYPGILLDVLSPEGMAEQIQSSMKLGAEGFSLFSAQSLTEKHLQTLRLLSFSQDVPAHKDFTPPLPPLKLSAFPTETASVKLAWENPPAAPDGDAQFTYNVYRAAKEKPKEVERVASRLSSPLYEDKNILLNVEYMYTVTALDDAGNESAFSGAATVTVTGSDKIPPYPPLNFRITQSFEGRISFTWDAPPAAEDGDVPSYFKLYRGVAGLAGTEICIAPRINSTYWTDFLDDFSSSYYYYAVSYDKENNASQLSEKIYHTPSHAGAVLPKPAVLSSDENVSGEILLQWQLPPVKEVDESSVVYYRVYRGEITRVEKEIEVPVTVKISGKKTNGANTVNGAKDANNGKDKKSAADTPTEITVMKKQKVVETVKLSPVLIGDKVEQKMFKDALFNGPREYYYQVAAVSKSGREGMRAEITRKFDGMPSSRVAFLISEYSAAMNAPETHIHATTCKQLFKSKGIYFVPVTDFLVEEGALTSKNFRLLVLPASRNMSKKEKQAVQKFVEKGGKILAFYQSAFKDENDDTEDKYAYMLGDVYSFRWSGFRNVPEKPGKTKRCMIIKPSASSVTSPLFSEDFPLVRLQKNVAMLNEPAEWIKELGAYYNEDGMTLSFDEAFNTAVAYGNSYIYFGADMCHPDNAALEDVQTLVARAANLLVPGLSDVTPPAPPQNVAGSLLMQNTVYLTWENANPSDKVTYTVYRSSDEENVYGGTVLAKDIAGTDFMDTKAAGSEKLFYGVIAKDAEKNKSKPSKIATVSTTTYVAVLREDDNEEYLKLPDAQYRSDALRKFLVDARFPFSLISSLDLEHSVLLDKPYKALIIPSASSFSAESVAQIQAFIQKGGKVLVFYDPSQKGGKTAEEFPLKDILGVSLYCYETPPEKVTAFIKLSDNQTIVKNGSGSGPFASTQLPSCFASADEGTTVAAEWLQADKSTPLYAGMSAAVTEHQGAVYFGVDFYKEYSNTSVRQMLKGILQSFL